ncbi:VCBS domain-containing protein, partial [Vibrio vulnificus]|uniref:VCBS domain-containing protein n=1 Tax=Vibrio vulnificus TaxID=672 RepID=UPI0005807A65
FTVTETNDAPVAEAATGSVQEDATSTGSISASDVDLRDDASLVFSTDSTVEGLTLNADGSYSFDASSYDSLEAGEKLVLEIPVTVTDDQNATDTKTLTINATGTNDAPVAEARECWRCTYFRQSGSGNFYRSATPGDKA